MKKLSIVAATLAIAGFASSAANAAGPGGTASGTFNVTVNLTPICQIASTTTFGASDALSNISLNYASFDPDTFGQTTFNVRCAAGLSYSVKLDAETVTTLGLTYTLGLAAGTTPAYTGGLTAVADTGATAGKAYIVGVKIAGGQGGDCGSGSNAACTNTTGRTVTVTY